MVKYQTKAQWQERGAVLADRLRKADHNQWAIGDWLVAGKKFFEGKMSDAYAEAEKVTGLTQETLQQYAHTARKVARLTRVKFPKLFFAHFRLVASFDDKQQEELLRDAQGKLGKPMSVSEFERHIATKMKGGPKDAEQRETTNPDLLARTFLKHCDNLLKHAAMKQLLRKAPTKGRQEIIEHIERTAKKLNDFAKRLPEIWRTYDCYKATKAAAAHAGSSQ